MPIGLLAAAALLAAGGGPALTPDAQAAPRVIRISTDSMVGSTSIVKGKSETFRISVPFTEVVVADPETADVNPLTDRTLYVLGRKLGTTNVTLFDERKRLVAVIDIEVTHDLTGLREALKSAIPSSSLKVKSVNGRVLIDGQVPSAPAAEKAMAIARDFAGEDVTNSLSIASLQQVNLEVRMIEVARSAGKELGDPPPLKWSDLKYVLWHQGGSEHAKEEAHA